MVLLDFRALDDAPESPFIIIIIISLSRFIAHHLFISIISPTIYLLHVGSPPRSLSITGMMMMMMVVVVVKMRIRTKMMLKEDFHLNPLLL